LRFNGLNRLQLNIAKTWSPQSYTTFHSLRVAVGDELQQHFASNGKFKGTIADR
jgi:hypothetical protein